MSLGEDINLDIQRKSVNLGYIHVSALGAERSGNIEEEMTTIFLTLHPKFNLYQTRRLILKHIHTAARALKSVNYKY